MKPVWWVGSARDDIQAFPRPVRREIGRALTVAQLGARPAAARPLKGFHGAGVLELIERHDGNTWRAVYTVSFPGAIYVLHAFQKKSKQGIATPKAEIDLVRARLQDARAHYMAHTHDQTD